MLEINVEKLNQSVTNMLKYYANVSCGRMDEKNKKKKHLNRKRLQ